MRGGCSVLNFCGHMAAHTWVVGGYTMRAWAYDNRPTGGEIVYDD
jgi:hypothetical protein